jgi:hypothetical protein
MYNILELNSKYLVELREIAQTLGIERVGIMKKAELIFTILNLQPVKITSPTSMKVNQAVNIVAEKPEMQKTGSFFRHFHGFLLYLRNYKFIKD